MIQGANTWVDIIAGNTNMATRMVLCLACTGTAISAAEMLSVRLVNGKRSFPWRCCDLLAAMRWPLRRFRLDLACQVADSTRLVVVLIHLVAATLVVLTSALGLNHGLLLFVAAASWLFISGLSGVGGDGANQMSTIILVSIALAEAVGKQAALSLTLYFIAAQSILAYIASGFAKALSPYWRLDNIVLAVVSTSSYGSRGFASALIRFPGIARAMTLGVIGFEILMPLTIFGPSQVRIPLLALAGMFHLGCAVTMGLNNFLWAFTATYPAVLYSAASLHTGR
jgi:hypothetical protein